MKRPQLQPSGVYFDELTHTYLREDGTEMKGITKTLLERAFPGTYDDIPEDVLMHAAERGTACHKAIENFIQDKWFDQSLIDVVTEATSLLRQRSLTPIEVEYVVTNGEDYASPIDIVCTDKKGNIVIVDIKTTSRKMFEHVQLQCSIYKMFFERQNPGLEVASLFCLWIHVNDDYDVLESDMFEMRPVDSEFIEHLIECDRNDTAFDITKFYGNLPAKLFDVEVYMKELDTLVREKTEELKNIKEGLLALMVEHNIKSFDNGRTRLTRVLPQQRTSFNTDKFRKDHPDLYKEYNNKVIQTKDSIRITFN